jgi:hypothetical protein
MSELLNQLPSNAVCMQAAAAGAPVTLDGLDVVTHEVVALVPAELKTAAEHRDGKQRRKSPTRA